MHTGMNVSMRGHIVIQARKITVFRGTGGVRPSLEISRMFSNICSHVPVWFLSKNAPVNKNPLNTPLFISVNHSLPAT